MKRKYIKIIIPVIFFMTIFIVSMLYILLHKNKEAEKGMDYASLSGVTGDSDFQNYWDTDGWYDLASVEGGYYYMNFEQMLLFLNLETNDVIAVCAKPECNHKTSECNAFLEMVQRCGVYIITGTTFIILDCLMALLNYAVWIKAVQQERQ